MFDLVVVIPVYNEDEVILDVIHDWKNVLGQLNINYRISVYNDGSKDNTQQVLETAFGNDTTVDLIYKENSGHGPTILQGYLAYIHKSQWLFQVDSDNEMPASQFASLWKAREHYDFLLGRRAEREQALSRKLTSLFSRLTVKLFTKASCYDVNSPFRLMRSECFAQFLPCLPLNTSTPNVILSGLAGMHKLRVVEFPVKHTNRTTGEVSIKKWKLFKFAVKAFFQTISVLTKEHLKHRA